MSQVGFNVWCSYKRKKKGMEDTGEKAVGRWRQRRQSHSPKPRDGCSHQKLEEARKKHPYRGVQPFGLSVPYWKKESCLRPHVKYIVPCNHKKKSHDVLRKFVILYWTVFIAILGLMVVRHPCEGLGISWVTSFLCQWGDSWWACKMGLRIRKSNYMITGLKFWASPNSGEVLGLEIEFVHMAHDGSIMLI